jgi:hypothetical protein
VPSSGRSGGLRGKLKHGRLLAFEQFGQEDHLPIGKFKGIDPCPMDTQSEETPRRGNAPGVFVFWNQTPISGHKNRNAPPRMATASTASMTIVISEEYHDSPGASSSFAHAFHASQLF